VQSWRNYNDETVEQALQDKMASKTSDAKTYRFKIGHGSFTVIDTPGFGDTRGEHAN
jgi:predicted GTPase